MANNLTAQNVFNGHGFDDAHMLSKAERELDRLRAARGMDPYDHMMNFSVTLSAVCDWTFHVHLSHTPLWSGKRESHFTNWVRTASPDAFVFIDISNEFKHANRAHPSTLAEKMTLSYIDFIVNPAMRTIVDQRKGWIQQVGNNDWFFFPSVKFNGTTEYFYDPAERAIAWWKAFVPATAQPMNAQGNVVP